MAFFMIPIRIRCSYVQSVVLTQLAAIPPFSQNLRLQGDGPVQETLTVDGRKEKSMLHIQYPHKVAELPITEVRRPAPDSQVRIRGVVTNQATAGCFS